jgi:hypothetical protein
MKSADFSQFEVSSSESSYLLGLLASDFWGVKNIVSIYVGSANFVGGIWKPFHLGKITNSGVSRCYSVKLEGFTSGVRFIYEDDCNFSVFDSYIKSRFRDLKLGYLGL